MNERHLVIAGATNMLLATGAGAFGAHLLKNRLAPDLLAVWQTGVTYHLIHALGLLVLAALWQRFPTPLLNWAGNLMLAGIVLFCGSLYVLALSGVRMLGAITPLGGLAFLAAWLLLALAAYRHPAPNR